MFRLLRRRNVSGAAANHVEGHLLGTNPFGNFGLPAISADTVFAVVALFIPRSDEPFLQQLGLVGLRHAEQATLFVGELAAGLLSGSMGLVADSLDMLADAFVYEGAQFRVAYADDQPVGFTLIYPFSEGEQRIVDLGTGSGAIAIALARANPRFRVTGVELSAPALALARENAARLAANNLDFIEGSWLSEQVCRQLTEGSGAAPRVDMIVSNPPYIAAKEMEGLAPETRLWEPRMALTDGADGLSAYRATPPCGTSSGRRCSGWAAGMGSRAG